MRKKIAWFPRKASSPDSGVRSDSEDGVSTGNRQRGLSSAIVIGTLVIPDRANGKVTSLRMIEHERTNG